MTSATAADKHVASQSKEDSNLGLGEAVGSAVDTSVAAVAKAGNAVLKHIPGTDEHVLHECKKEIERTGVDFHVADGQPIPRQQKNIEETQGQDEARKLHKTISIHPGS